MALTCILQNISYDLIANLTAYLGFFSGTKLCWVWYEIIKIIETSSEFIGTWKLFIQVGQLLCKFSDDYCWIVIPIL